MEGFEALDISTPNCTVEKKGHVMLVTLNRPEAKKCLKPTNVTGYVQCLAFIRLRP
jgi:enoyl-CoA hydratase